MKKLTKNQFLAITNEILNLHQKNRSKFPIWSNGIDPYDFMASSFSQTIWRYTLPQDEWLKMHLQDRVGVIGGNRPNKPLNDKIGIGDILLTELQAGTLIGEITKFYKTHVNCAYRDENARSPFRFMTQEIADMLTKLSSSQAYMKLAII